MTSPNPDLGGWEQSSLNFPSFEHLPSCLHVNVLLNYRVSMKLQSGACPVDLYLLPPLSISILSIDAIYIHAFYDCSSPETVVWMKQVFHLHVELRLFGQAVVHEKLLTRRTYQNEWEHLNEWINRDGIENKQRRDNGDVAREETVSKPDTGRRALKTELFQRSYGDARQ